MRANFKTVTTVVNATSTISFTIINQNEFSYTTHWHFMQLGTNFYIPLDSKIFDSTHLSDDGLTLMLLSCQLHHRGTYRITVSNLAANVTATVNFDVFGKLHEIYDSYILLFFYLCVIVPAKLLYTAGVSIEKERRQNISFNCTADGIPMPTIVWRKDGHLIIPFHKRSVTVQSSTGFRSSVIPGVLQTTSILTISGLTGSDNGNYSCRADNKANIGTVLIEPFILTVVERKY